MEQLNFQFNFGKLKIGDKVEIVDKTLGDPLPSWNWKKGMVAYVAEIANNAFDVEHFGCTGYFLASAPDEEHRSGRFARNDLRRM